MRILPIAMIGLALLAGCSSMRTQQSAAPAPQPMASSSGSMATTSTTAQGDAIDRFAAAYEAQHPMRRY